MEIPAPRLRITSFDETHAEAFFDLTEDEGFRLHPITNYQQSGLESARRWITEARALNASRGLGKWGVWEKSSGELIGMGGLTPWQWEGEELVDVTYRLRASAWGKGYGVELAQSLVQYGFGVLKLSQITATITPENLASKKIAEKLGMDFDKDIVLLGVPTELYRLRKAPVGARRSN